MTRDCHGNCTVIVTVTATRDSAACNLMMSLCLLSVLCARVYYHFRPDFWFWIIVILLRKISIAATALMFSSNPAFQMALALLFLFICYALQVCLGPRGHARLLTLRALMHLVTLALTDHVVTWTYSRTRSRARARSPVCPQPMVPPDRCCCVVRLAAVFTACVCRALAII